MMRAWRALLLYHAIIWSTTTTRTEAARRLGRKSEVEEGHSAIDLSNIFTKRDKDATTVDSAEKEDNNLRGSSSSDKKDQKEKGSSVKGYRSKEKLAKEEDLSIGAPKVAKEEDLSIGAPVEAPFRYKPPKEEELSDAEEDLSVAAPVEAPFRYKLPKEEELSDAEEGLSIVDPVEAPFRYKLPKEEELSNAAPAAAPVRYKLTKEEEELSHAAPAAAPVRYKLTKEEELSDAAPAVAPVRYKLTKEEELHDVAPDSTPVRKGNKDSNSRDNDDNEKHMNCKFKDGEATYLLTFTEDTSFVADKDLIKAFYAAYNSMTAIWGSTRCKSQIEEIDLQERERDGAEHVIEFYIGTQQARDTKSLLELPQDEQLFVWGFNIALDNDDVELSGIRIPGPTASPSQWPLISAPTLTPTARERLPPPLPTLQVCNFLELQSTYVVSFHQDVSTLTTQDLVGAFFLGYDAMKALFPTPDCPIKLNSIDLKRWDDFSPDTWQLVLQEQLQLNNNNKREKEKDKERKKNKRDGGTVHDLVFDITWSSTNIRNLLLDLPDEEPLFLWGFNAALNSRIRAFAINHYTRATHPPIPGLTPAPHPPTYPPTSPPAPTPVPTESLWFGNLTYVGNDHDGYFYSRYPMGVCQGDCDTDNDCQQGLYCHQRKPLQATPHCSGGEDLDSSMDFCTWDPSYPPPEPLPAAPVDAYRLKLYWDPSYRWQNETYDREWCMVYDFDGYPGNGECHGADEVQECSPTEIYLGYCLDNDPRQWFTVIPLGDKYSKSKDHNEWLIKTVVTPLTTTNSAGDRRNNGRAEAQTERCLARRKSQIYLTERCDPKDEKQRFFALNGTISPLPFASFERPGRFELGQFSGYTHDNCVTNAHHPKSGELIEFHVCEDVRSEEDETSYWQLIPGSNKGRSTYQAVSTQSTPKRKRGQVDAATSGLNPKGLPFVDSEEEDPYEYTKPKKESLGRTVDQDDLGGPDSATAMATPATDSTAPATDPTTEENTIVEAGDDSLLLNASALVGSIGQPSESAGEGEGAPDPLVDADDTTPLKDLESGAGSGDEILIFDTVESVLHISQAPLLRGGYSQLPWLALSSLLAMFAI